MLFSFSKRDSAVFHGHLSLLELFSMAFNRSSLRVAYTQGFNPLVKMELVAPLTTGISADAEIAAVDCAAPVPPETFILHLNRSLPDGIRVGRAECFVIPGGHKKHSLSSLLWGFSYHAETAHGEPEYIPAAGEKEFRTTRLAATGASVFSLSRRSVLARNIGDTSSETPWASYFDAYRFLYP
jgi:radical SAM-linked protein